MFGNYASQHLGEDGLTIYKERQFILRFGVLYTTLIFKKRIKSTI
jgi:hypothetical protein